MIKLNKLSIKILIGLSCCLILVTYPTFLSAQNSEDELFLVAQKAFEDGFYDVAIRYIDQLLTTFPQTEKRVQTSLLLGQCHYFKKQYLKAYDTFQELLDFPEYKDATLFWLGETYLKGSDYLQAEKHYRQLIELFPKSVYTPQAYYSLGWLFFDQNKFEEAKENFSLLLIKFPTSTFSEDASFKIGETEYNLKSYDTTIEFFHKYVEEFPQSTRHAEAYFYIAESYYYLDQPLDAVTYYSKAAKIAYDNKLILMAKISLGWSYLKLGKLDLAKVNFDEAFEFSKNKKIVSDDVFLGQASLYAETQEYEKSLIAYQQLIDQFPNSNRIPEASLGEANTYYLLENYNMAIQSYQKTIDRFADDPQQQDVIEKSYFGKAWSQLKTGDIDASIGTFRTIQDKAENKIVKISALTQIGDAYQDINRYEKSIQVYDNILNDFPDSPYTDYVQYRLGIALLKTGALEESTLAFQSLKANFPQSKYLKDVEYYLAVANFQRSNWQASQTHIKIFLEPLSTTDDFQAEALYILGLTHFNLDEYAEAIKTFQNILKNHPQQISLTKNAEISIAKCLYKLDNITEALKRFEILANKYPLTEVAQEALIALGDHYINVSDFEKAIIYFKNVLNDFPGSSKRGAVLYTLGETYQSMEKYDKALQTYQQVKEPMERALIAKAQLAIAEIFSKELDATAALKTYQNVITTTPEYQRDAFVKIAEVYKDQKSLQLTVENYRKALTAEKKLSQFTDVKLQFLIADVYDLMNQNDQAIEEYFKIPYLYPEETQWVIKSYLRAARLFEDKEKWDQAKNVYNKVIALKTNEEIFARERLEWIDKNVPLELQ